jgi:hypothetical protein
VVEFGKEGETMNPISNQPKITSGLIPAIRNLFEHRALWLYLLVDEARKQGLAPEKFAPAAVGRCGLYQGGLLADQGASTSLKTLKKKLFGFIGQKIFEMKILKVTDDNLDIDFHYCPLISAWQKQNCSQEDCIALCDFAMAGDRGIAESFGCVLELPKTIARGDGVCELRFKRKAT